ncbi:MAG: hypothetical protein ACP5IO_01760, partial [Elusimicrobiales bacterium]
MATLLLHALLSHLLFKEVGKVAGSIPVGSRNSKPKLKPDSKRYHSKPRPYHRKPHISIAKFKIDNHKQVYKSKAMATLLLHALLSHLLFKEVGKVAGSIPVGSRNSKPKLKPDSKRY